MQLRMMGARPMMMPGCCGGCPGASGEGEGSNAAAGASQGATSCEVLFQVPVIRGLNPVIAGKPRGQSRMS